MIPTVLPCVDREMTVFRTNEWVYLATRIAMSAGRS